jgi:2-polyprenyl-6-methoxyphenol hydroxylase-like FAD-dependent oxidoreductase
MHSTGARRVVDNDAPGSVDVLVIGAGPAGSAAALVLAGHGWQVAIADRPQQRRSRIVETLPPPSRSTLRSLGLWTRFVAAGHVPASGIVSWWDTAHPIEHDFILNPSGSEWHVDRQCFDRLMAAAAIEAGAVRLPIERLVDAAVEGTAFRQRWRIRLLAAGRLREISARFLVNASGRTAAFRPRESSRLPVDRLVGLAAVFDPFASDVDRRPWIEATPSGWWYSAPGSDGRWTAVFFTDADLSDGSGHRSLATRWALAVAEGPHTAGRLREIGSPSSGPIPELHVLAANSYITTRCQGDRWLAAGDAASAVDPLSGQGIERALRAGIRAAHTIDAVLNAETGANDARRQAAIDEYQRDQTATDREYLAQRHECYARVRRWTDRPFWKRRA